MSCHAKQHLAVPRQEDRGSLRGDRVVNTISSALTIDRRGRLRGALKHAPFDAFLAVSAANILYATGYRSIGGTAFGHSSIAALVTGSRTLVAAPVSEAAAVTDDTIAVEDFVPYGRFYFESASELPPAFTSDAHSDLVGALKTCVCGAGLQTATIGVDEAAINPSVLARLTLALPDVRFVDMSGWALGVRSQKLSGEVTLLERAAHLAEDGVKAAIDSAGVGVTEKDLAAIVNGVIVAGGGEPRFTVVSSGPRSAFADVFATDRPLTARDLVRFDVGCVVEGYWSDIGRTAVVGEPTKRQADRYAAILEGEEQELQAVRPGVTAQQMFRTAVQVVEAGGITPYRRQHCGHGIGTEVYEPPIISAGTADVITEGMTFCFETPFYEVGWGGMMVEDSLVITADGHRRFTTTDRGLRVIPA